MQHIELSVKTLNQLGEYSASHALLKTLEKHSETYEQLDFVARLQNESKEYASAVANLERMLARCADNHQCYSIRANLAKMLNHMNEPHKSIMYSKANLSIKPDDYDAKMEIQFSHYLAGEKKESKEILMSLLSDEKTPTEIRDRCRYNKGSWDLEDGNFEEGLFNHVVVGHEKGIIPIEQTPMIPSWDGSIDPNKTVLILGEGGIGDQFVSVRFCKHLENLGLKSIFVTTTEQIKEVFVRNGYRSVLRSEIHGIEEALVQVQAFYLPLMLQLSTETVWRGSYITPDQAYIDKWEPLLPLGRKLAVKWFGNNLYDQDLHRSLPLEKIEALKFDGKKISLQLEKYDGDKIEDFSDQINNIEDTLAIIWLCDSVVSSCTSVVHMAGSMGKECIVCPPIATYFTWLGAEGKSHWYDDSMHVVRQRNWKDWDSVFDKVNEILNDKSSRLQT